MDPALSTVIVAVITGIFAVVTLLIQKRQDKVITKIDQQTTFIESEKKLKQELTRKEKECNAIINEVMMLILDTNLSILRNTQMSGGVKIDESVFETSENLKERFKKALDEIEKITEKHDMILQVADEFQLDVESNKNKKE